MNDSYDKTKSQAREWNKQNAQELGDSYIIKLLKHEGVVNPDKEMIELKRLTVQLKRVCAKNK